MGSPYPLIMIFGIYLLVVLKLGPMFMENREAYNLNVVKRSYNLYQICSCICVSAGSLVSNYKFIWTLGWKCEPDWSEQAYILDIGCLIFFLLYILLRLSEIIETIIFVLCKKQTQITFLHCYHHIAVVFVIWISFKYSGHSREVFIALVNTTVHSVM